MRWFMLLAVLALICVLWWLYWPRPPVATIALELEANGGFAYIETPEENTVEIAYLRDTSAQSAPVCQVDQLGVDLMVISGNIIEPANPPASRKFDLEGAVVTFADLNKSTKTLVVNRGNRPQTAPFGPANPMVDHEWADLRWVPGASYALPKANYPASSLNPNWRDLVDGRVVLTRGEISAAHPSDLVARNAIFEFKTQSGSISPFKQAVTDTTIFRADIPANQIEINLTGAKSRVQRIIVVPSAPERPVKLKLMARHSHQVPGALGIGQAVDHYCAFYQLLQPVPAAQDQLVPHLFSGPTIALAGGGTEQPSPGPYCPTMWYPE